MVESASGAGTNCLSADWLPIINTTNQNMNASKTSYTWDGGGDGVYLEIAQTESTLFQCKVEGYYLVNVLLWSTVGTSNNRSLIYGYVSVLDDEIDGGGSRTEIKRYHFGNSYYRDDNPDYNDTVLSGSSLVFLRPTQHLQIISEVAYRQNSSTNPGDSTKCQLYIEYTGMK